MRGNKTNHPKKWMRYDEWEKWLLTEWYPFKTNDFAHLKADVNWIKRILFGILFALIAGAIAILLG